jgi:uncharacterized RDD family membrane protein YckC
VAKRLSRQPLGAIIKRSNYLKKMDKKEDEMEETTQNKFQNAGAGRRFLNLIIDMIIIYVISFLEGIILNVLFGSEVSKYICAIYIISLGTIFLYYYLFEYIFQKTIAKFITGTKIVLNDGARVNSKAVIIRTISRFIPFEAFSIYTGKDEEQKNTWWHDRWSKTSVIKG